MDFISIQVSSFGKQYLADFYHFFEANKLHTNWPFKNVYTIIIKNNYILNGLKAIFKYSNANKIFIHFRSARCKFFGITVIISHC